MPFASYKNFADCVAKNKNKAKNPKAYCATIMRAVEGKKNYSKGAVKRARKMA